MLMPPSCGRTWRPLVLPIAFLALAACGPKHHLDQYDFAGRTMALVVIGPTAPVLLQDSYRVRADNDLVATVVNAGATAIKNAEAGRARSRLDSATTRMALADALAERTIERASRYLGVQPAESKSGSDFLLEVHMRNYGIDARGRSTASAFVNSVADFQDALDQLVQLSSNVIVNELRGSLRDARSAR